MVHPIYPDGPEIQAIPLTSLDTPTVTSAVATVGENGGNFVAQRSKVSLH